MIKAHETRRLLQDYDRYFRDVWLLSRQERTVAILLLQGLSNRQVAVRLGVGFETANKHIDSIYRKGHVVGGRRGFFSHLLLNATI